MTALPRWSIAPILLIAGDVAALFAGAVAILAAALGMTLGPASPGWSIVVEPRFGIYCALAAVLLALFWASRHYSTQPPRWREIGEMVRATLLVALIDVGITAVLGGAMAPVSQLANWLAVLVLLVGLRMTVRTRIRRRPGLKPVLAVVPGGLADAIPRSPRYRLESLSEPVLPDRAAALVVDFNHELSGDWMRLLGEAAVRGRPVLAASEVYEDVTGRVSLRHLNERHMETLQPPAFYQVVKRGLDGVALVLATPVVLPLLALIAAAIKLESRGPVLFKQTRVGAGGELFTLVKFRSMREPDPARGYGFADEDADRITRVGHVLRRLHLDELPQLWNVLKGEMTLIGPRPEFDSFAREFEKAVPLYRYRYTVRPGVTGWAQVRQGSTSGTAAIWRKLEYDLYYIKRMSLWLDVVILALTARKLLPGRKPRPNRQLA